MNANKVLSIARLTFKAALNEKLLHLAVLFALVLMIFSVALADLGPRANAKILADFGMGTIQAVAVLIAIVLASNDMPRELERRTLYVVLSKPIGRASLLVGKFLGMFAALGLLMLAMAAVFFGVLALTHMPLSAQFVVAIAMGALEVFVLTAFAMFFSLITSPTLASLYTLVLFFLGHQTGTIRAFGRQAGGSSQAITEALYRVIPNFEAMNLKNDVIYGLLPAAPKVWAGFAYGLCLIVALMAASVLVFRRKEI